MVAHDTSAPAAAAASPEGNGQVMQGQAGAGQETPGQTAPGQESERKVRIVRVSAEGTATVIGAGLGALGLVWVLYERVLAFSGVLGFWVSWYAVFLLL